MIISRTAPIFALAAVLACGLGLAGCEKSVNNGPAPATDNSADTAGAASTVPGLPFLARPVFSPDLVDMAGGLDLFAVAEGRLAQAQSQNAAVKALAARSVEAHGRSLTALSAAIDASSQTLSMPDTMTGDLQAKVTALQKLTGAAFDKAYVNDQIDLERAQSSALRFYAKHGDTAQFKSYANALAPTSEADLAAAQTVRATIR